MRGIPLPKITPKNAPRLVRRVEVFGRGNAFRKPAKFLLDVDQAADLVDTKSARRVSKYRIELTEKGENELKARFIKLRDESCSPTEATMNKVIKGSRTAAAMIDSWAFRFPVTDVA